MATNPTWLSVVRGSALGWTPASKQDLPKWTESQFSAKTRATFSVIINVSGTRFKVPKWQLDKHPFTLLGSSEIEYFWDEADNEYYFSRDPDIFKYILNYYQTGRLHYPRFACVSAFEEELAFFGLPGDIVDECCYEDYKEKQRDNLDRTRSDDSEEPADTPKTFRGKIQLLLDNPDSGVLSRAIYYISGFLIAISVTANIVDTIPFIHSVDESVSLGQHYQSQFFIIDTACVAIFTIEYGFRFYAAPNRFKFFRTIMSIIDLAAIIPYYVSLLSVTHSTFAAFVTLRVFRVFRIFKLSRHSAGLRILGATLRTCASELGFLVFSLVIAIIIFATVVYYCEKDVPDTAFTSIPATCWYTIVTITTLGYGDMTPVTVMGKIVGGICSLSGVLVIALPVPVIVNNFSRIYIKNQRAGRHKCMLKARLNQIRKARRLAAGDYILNTKRFEDFTPDSSERFGVSNSKYSLEPDVEADAEAEAATGAEQGMQQQFTKDFTENQHYHLLWTLETATGRKFIAEPRRSRALFGKRKPPVRVLGESIVHFCTCGRRCSSEGDCHGRSTCNSDSKANLSKQTSSEITVAAADAGAGAGVGVGTSMRKQESKVTFSHDFHTTENSLLLRMNDDASNRRLLDNHQRLSDDSGEIELTNVCYSSNGEKTDGMIRKT